MNAESAFQIKSRAWRRLMKDLLRSGKRFDALLDVPCGRAELFRYARKKCRRYHGIDPEPVNLRHAKIRHATSQFRMGDITRIPYPSGMFDVVLSWGGFTGIEPGKLEQALKEVFRVSRRYVAFNVNALLKEDEKAPDDSVPVHVAIGGVTYLRGKHLADMITLIDRRWELVGLWQYGLVEQVGDLKYAGYVNLYELCGRPINAPPVPRPDHP